MPSKQYQDPVTKEWKTSALYPNELFDLRDLVY